MEKQSARTGLAGLILSYIVFGSIGIFVRFIPLPSSAIAAFRGIVGGLFILGFMLITKRAPSFKDIGKNLTLLLISGIAIGFNWILLFEAYRYTSVATATLCYYMAPVFVVPASVIFLKERLTVINTVCISAAFVGMIFVSGIFTGGIKGIEGILLGLGAALLYASVIICNKKFEGISAFDRTFFQLLIAGLTVVPYMLICEDWGGIKLEPTGIILLIVVGLLHTGVAYLLYFGAVAHTPAQTVGLLSYIDPVVAIFISAVILKEQPDIYTIIGAALILLPTLYSSTRKR